MPAADRAPITGKAQRDVPQAVTPLVTGATGIRDVTDVTLVGADGVWPERGPNLGLADL
ncbi:hypothetical protein ACFRH6_25385 [Streptomyces sp. NPDC056749]|uniref:hypothetical protein n=1 Tax=Streptomyces sp. NPDC056749 TaxID=3345936 RepID=UPI0036CC4177